MGPDDLTVESLPADGGEKRYRITRPNGRHVWDITLRQTRRVKGRTFETGFMATITSPSPFEGRTAFIGTEQDALQALKDGIWSVETGLSA